MSRRVRIALCDYDKPHRCPGWSGSGWTSNRENWCRDDLAAGTPRWAWHGEDGGYGSGWFLRIRRTNCCGTYVLPHALVWLHWRSWVPSRFGPGLWWWYAGRRFSEIPTSIRVARFRRRARRQQRAA